jgi:hypothetical protein
LLDAAMKRLCRDKKAQLELLMNCVKNCGYEFDNEKTFEANKKVLLRPIIKLGGGDLCMEDVGEE